MLELARPLVNKAACLECHDTAATAPAIDGRALWQRRMDLDGSRERSSAPRSSRCPCPPRRFGPNISGGSSSCRSSVFSCCLFVSINVLLHFVVIRPMEKIADNADAVSMGKIDTPEFRYKRRRPDRPPGRVIQSNAPQPRRGYQDARRVSETSQPLDELFPELFARRRGLRAALRRRPARSRHRQSGSTSWTFAQANIGTAQSNAQSTTAAASWSSFHRVRSSLTMSPTRSASRSITRSRCSRS